MRRRERKRKERGDFRRRFFDFCSPSFPLSTKKRILAHLLENHSPQDSLSPPSFQIRFTSLSLSLSSLSRAKPEAMEERKKLPMKYVYVSPRSAGGVGKQERSICRRERQGETDCAMVGRRRRRRRRQQQQQRRRRLFAARTPRMLLLPFVLRSCRPLFEEPTRAPPCIGRTESC